MKKELIFAIVAVITAVLVSCLPFILCIWVEKGHTNYGVILALFIVQGMRKVNEQKRK